MQGPEAGYIEIEPNPRRVLVHFNGQTVADSVRAVTVRESGRPPVHYIPRADVDMKLLFRAPHASHCPHKGDAAYYSIHVGVRHATIAVWTYERPYPAVEALRDLLAFHPDRVDGIEEEV